MPWIYLLIAGLLEVGWAVGLKFTEGWTRFWPSAITLVLMVASLYFLSLSVRGIPLGTAYGIWTGMGAVLTAILGMVLFGEPRTVVRMLCLLLIVAGIAGLKLSAASLPSGP
jgi:quaternary ammonium compound-resistance protein SugE